MRRLWLACAALSMLPACDRSPTPIEPTPKASSTSTASPTTDPSSTLQPPKLPAIAKRNDETGAANFVAYWVKVSDHAAVTGDTELLRDISEADCAGCDKYISLYERTYAGGGSFEGGAHRLTNVTTQTSSSGTYVTAVSEAAPGSYVLKRGEPERSSKAESTNVTFRARFADGAWVMSDVGLSGQ